MIVKELIARLGFTVNQASVSAVNSSMLGAKEKMRGVGNEATVASAKVSQLGAKAAAAGAEVSRAGVTAGGGWRGSFVSSISNSRQALSGLGASVTQLRGQLLSLGMYAIGGFGLFALAQGAITAGDNVYKLAARLRLSNQEALQLSRMSNMAGMSATQLAGVMTRLDRSLITAGPKGNEATKAMKEFGVSLTDGSGKLLPFTAQLKGLATAYNDAVSNGVGDEFVSKVLGPRGMAMIPLLEGYADMAAAEKKIQGTAILDPKAAHEAKIEMMAMQMQASQLGMALSASLIPIVRDVITHITAFTTAAAKFTATHRELVLMIGRVVAAFVGLAAAVKVGQIIFSMFNLIKGAVSALGITASLSTAGWILALIAVGLVLQDIYTWINGGDSLIGRWLGTWDNFKGKLDGIKAVAGTIFDAMAQKVQEVWPYIQRLGTAFMQLLDAVMPVVMFVGGVLLNVFIAAITPAILLVRWLIDQFIELVTTGGYVADAITAAFEGFLTSVTDIMNIARDVFSGNWSQAIADVKKYFSDLESFATRIIMDIASAIGTYVLDKIRSAKTAITDFLGWSQTQTQNAVNDSQTSYQNNVNVNQTFNGGTSSENADSMKTGASDVFGGLGPGLQYDGGAV